MRALCGAIIAAGSLIGLGLTALGLGIRYQAVRYEANTQAWVHFRELDTPMAYILVMVSIVLAIGLAIALVGLAFHHERRHWERQHHLHQHGASAPAHPPL
jgi:cell division protein FtsX